MTNWREILPMFLFCLALSMLSATFAARDVATVTATTNARSAGDLNGQDWQSMQANRPQSLVAAHPRLFLNVNDVATLRIKAATTHQEIWQPIKAYVDTQLLTAPPAEPSATAVEDTFRLYGNQLIPLAFTCVITDRPEYCELAKHYVMTYAGWRQWDANNQRDLGHAHMLMGMAIAYDWLYAQFTPAERQTVGASLADWAEKMYEASVATDYHAEWRNWWRQSYLQNHHWTNNSALGMAGLALLHEDERAMRWIDQAAGQLEHVQFILNGIQDGSWHEGIPYQNYGLTMLLPFLSNLQKNLQIDLFPHTYLRNYTLWGLYNLLPFTTQFILAYGDFEWWWGNSYRPQNIYRFIASAYADGHAEWIAQQLIDADGRQSTIWATPWYVFEFFYYDPAVKAQPPTDLAPARGFPDLEGVIWRTGWKYDDLVFGLKTGAYGGRFGFNTFTQEQYPWQPSCPSVGCQLNAGHDHNDSNTFYLYRAGHWLATETVGVNAYVTELHNTLLIDGQGQGRPAAWDDPDQLIDSDGYLEMTATTPNFAYVAADATRRYRHIPGLEDVTRHVIFVRPDYFLMVDNLAATSQHNYEWVAHFGESVELQENWVRGNAGGDQVLGVGIVAPMAFHTTTGYDGQPYVRIRPTAPVEDARLVNLLYPTTDATWSTRPKVVLLDDNGQALLVRLQRKDGSQLVDDILLTYAQSTTSDKPAVQQLGSYLFDGQVAVVLRNADNHIQRFVVYGGTFLMHQATGRPLVTDLPRGRMVEAEFTGQSLVVTSNAQAKITLYAPDIEHLIVNGEPTAFARTEELITFRITGDY